MKICNKGTRHRWSSYRSNCYTRDTYRLGYVERKLEWLEISFTKRLPLSNHYHCISSHIRDSAQKSRFLSLYVVWVCDSTYLKNIIIITYTYTHINIRVQWRTKNTLERSVIEKITMAIFPGWRKIKSSSRARTQRVRPGSQFHSL